MYAKRIINGIFVPDLLLSNHIIPNWPVYSEKHVERENVSENIWLSICFRFMLSEPRNSVEI